MKIKFLKAKKSFKKENHNANPDFFWGLLLGLAAILVTTSCVFGFLLFRKVNKESALEAEVIQGKSQTIRKARIGKVLEHFALREKKSAEILSSPSPFVDPSR